MLRPLTLPGALRLLLRGCQVPQPLYESLKRSGAFVVHRRRLRLTVEGRAILHEGDEVGA